MEGDKIVRRRIPKDEGNPGQFLIPRRSSFRRSLAPLSALNEAGGGLAPEKPKAPPRRRTIQTVAELKVISPRNASDSSSSKDGHVVLQFTPRGQQPLSKPASIRGSSECDRSRGSSEEIQCSELPSKRGYVADRFHESSRALSSTENTDEAVMETQAGIEQSFPTRETDLLPALISRRRASRTKTKEELDSEFEKVYASMENEITEKMELEETTWIAGHYIEKIKDDQSKSRTVYVDRIMGWNSSNNDREDDAWVGVSAAQEEPRTAASESCEVRHEVKAQASDSLPKIIHRKRGQLKRPNTIM